MPEDGALLPSAPLDLLARIREGLVVVDDLGTITFVNEAAGTLLGWAPNALVGRPFTTLVPERLHDEVGRGHRRMLRRFDAHPVGRPFRLPVVHKDGEEVEVDVVLSPLTAGDAVLVAATLRPVDTATVDTTALAMESIREVFLDDRSFAQTTQQVVALLGRHLGHDVAMLWLPDTTIDRLQCRAAWTADPVRFGAFERTSRELTFARGEGFAGRAWDEGLPQWSVDVVDDVRFARSDDDAGRGLQTMIAFPVRAGGEIVGIIELFSTGRTEPDPALARALTQATADIGPWLQRRLLDEVAREESARLALALGAGEMGVWHWDLRSGIITGSEPLERTLGRQGDFRGTVDDFLELVHPSDRRAVTSAFTRAVDRSGSRTIRLEYRILRPDGSVRWLESRGCALTDEAGTPITMTGVSTDITVRKEAEREFEAQHARLDLALEATGMGVWTWDAQTGRVRASLPLQLTLGFPRNGRIEQLVEHIHPDDRARVTDRVAQALADGQRFTFNHRVVRPDGSVRWVSGRGAAVRDASDAVVQLTGVAADVTDQRAGDLEAHLAQARLTTALEAGHMGVWHWDLRSGEATLSEPFTQSLGLPDAGSVHELIDHVHPDDRQRLLDDATEAVSRGGVDAEYRVLVPAGQTRWMHVRGQVVRDANAEPVGMTGVVADITERKAAERRLARKGELLAALEELGRAVTSNLEHDAVSQLVTDAATRLTGAEFGAFFYNVLDQDGDAYTLYALSGAPREAFDGFPMPRTTPLFEPTYRGEGTIVIDDVTLDPRYGHNDPYHGMPEGHLPVRSYLAVPVVSGEEVIGGLFFGHSEASRFDEHDAALAEGVAAQAAVAVANARAYDVARFEIAAHQQALADRDAVARTLQQSLLPPHLPSARGLEFGSVYRAGTEAVGGDFYDVFRISGRQWGVVIGDVCGKGPEAAALTALTRYTIRSAAVVERQPRDVLRFLNDSVIRFETDRFCSAVYVRLQVQRRGGATLQVGLAGHPPPLLLHTDGSVEQIRPTGMLLGLVDQPDPDQHSATLRPGDTLVLYTDGVTEARSGRDRFGTPRLVDLVASLAGAPPQELAEKIRRDIEEFEDGRRLDDLAVLTLRATG